MRSPCAIVGAFSLAATYNKKQLFWRDEASGRQVEIEAVDENGELITWNRVCGRGADLFLCDGARVRMLSLNEIDF